MKKVRLQRARLEEKAYELECDEDKGHFNDMLKRIAKCRTKKEDKQLNE